MACVIWVLRHCTAFKRLNSDHPLFVLAGLIDWDRFNDAYAPLFWPDKGTPALPTRLMVALEYLKYTYNLSDEELAPVC